MFARISGLLGSLGLIYSIFLPMVRLYNYAALWQNSIALTVLLLAVSITNIFFLYKSDTENFKKSSYVTAGVTSIILFTLHENMIWATDISSQNGSVLISLFVASSSTLIISTLLCLSAPFLHTYVDSRPVLDPSLPKDSGRCDKCGQVNSRAAKNCHNCGAILPWAVPISAQQKIPTAKGAHTTFDVTSWLKAAFVNVVTFLFSLSAPFLGYFLWKYLEKEDSPYAPVAIIGSIIGVIFYIGRFVWGFIKVGSAISQ